MFLKSLDIYGFKSFADKTHIDFAEGITALLGPNGCGKSNIVDSIKWVLGEKSTKSLRAGKMEDVIFNGTDTRKPMPFAEVELTIDNSEHHLPTDVTEVSIKRRYFRAADQEYFLNGQKCLKRNISELFMDTGVGKSAYSILEQGKIDQILSTKPEDRRYLFEEAAGISRFKEQCRQAQLDIEKTNANIDDILRSYNAAKRDCDRSRSQAEKAKKARELNAKAFDIDVRFNLARIRTYTLMKEERERLSSNAANEIQRLSTLMDTLAAEIEKEQEELKKANSSLYSFSNEINNVENSINLATTLINEWMERFQEASTRLKTADDKIANIQSSIDRTNAEIEMMEDRLQEREDGAEEEAKQIAAIVTMQEKKRSQIESLSAEEQEKEARNDEIDKELLALSEELKEVIEALIAQVDENTGSEFSGERRDKAENAFRSKAEELEGIINTRISFLSGLKDDSLVSRDITKNDFSKVLGGVDELIKLFDEYIASIPPVVDLILSSEGLIGKKRSIEQREREARAESLKNKMRLAEIRKTIETLRTDIDSLGTALDQQRDHYRETLSTIEQQKASIQSMKNSIEEKEAEKEDVISSSERDRNAVQDFLDRIKAKEAEREENKLRIIDMKREQDERQQNVNNLTNALNDKRNEKDKAFNDLNEARRIQSEQTGYLSSTDNLIQNVYEEFFRNYSRNLGEYMIIMKDEELPDDQLLHNEYEEVKKEIEKLGTVNYLAEDDYNAAKEQYDFYAKHLEDLNKAKADLEKVLEEIETKAKDMFLETYTKISDNFQAMFTRLFGGGIAKLTLEDPENVLTSGIDIFAQPPGKKLVTLSLLSGGERSMTAVALLFATYQVKPSPFCILDELDAALDDKNVGFFLDVLADFGKESQFIIITHNKHTVTGAETLLGVTQEEPGVSKTVNYRLERIAGREVIMNDDNSVVDFDKDGNRT